MPPVIVHIFSDNVNVNRSKNEQLSVTPLAISNPALPTILPVYSYEVVAGESLTYICKEGKALKGEDGEDKRTVRLECGDDGRYRMPREWPTCV